MSKREWKQIGKSAQWISGGEGDEEIEAQYDEDRRDMKKDNEDKIRDEQDSTHASLKYKRVEADLLNSLEDAKSAAGKPNSVLVINSYLARSTKVLLTIERTDIG